MGLLGYPKRVFIQVGSSLAIHLNKRKLKKRPDDLGRWLILAKLFAVRGDADSAIETLESAKKLFPNSTVINRNLYLLKQGQTDHLGI